MPRVRVPLSVNVSVSEATIGLLKAAAPIVRLAREHGPELRALGTAAKASLAEAIKAKRLTKARSRK